MVISIHTRLESICYFIEKHFLVAVKEHLEVFESKVRAVVGILVNELKIKQDPFDLLESVGIENSALQNLFKDLFSYLLWRQVIVFKI